MTMHLSIPDNGVQTQPRITVFGVGGAGGNAVDNMIAAALSGVDFVVANTDAQALQRSQAERRIQLGSTITRGLGAGARPDIGRAAAEEQIEEIRSYLDGVNMVFITAGMGGGTGTGAAPVIAAAAREQGILTVGVVTKPFHFEGHHRMRLAESGIAELQKVVDTLIIIPNQNLFRIANEKTTFADAFKMADDVLHAGVRGVTDLMVMPGLINLDFADIRTVMSEMGKAMMGTGEAIGERRAIEAAEAAINNPLLDDVSMKGARGVLINVTGGMDLTLFEVDEAANHIRDVVDPEANIIFGSTFDETLAGKMRVSVVATGIDAEVMAQPRPGHLQGAANAVRRGVVTSPAPVRTIAMPATNGIPAYRSDARSSEPALGLYAAAPLGLRAAADDMAAAGVSEELQSVAAPMPPAYLEELAPEPARAPANFGPLRGERLEGQFVAPRPAEAGPRPGIIAPVPASYTPPAEQQVEPVRKRTSLLSRLVDVGRSATARRPAEMEAPPMEQRMAPPPVAAPPVMARPAAPAPQPQIRQPAEMFEHPKLSKDEEDMLDIPAFLRRQAN